MCARLASINDTEYTLIVKAAWNLYDRAVADGATDLSEPSINDKEFDLLKKIVSYTAYLAGL